MPNVPFGIPLAQVIGQIVKDITTTSPEDMQRRQDEVERTGKPYDPKEDRRR